MIRKKVIIGILVLFAAIMMVGCGSGSSDADASDQQAATVESTAESADGTTNLLDAIGADLSDYSEDRSISDNDDRTVYYTKSGNKYHADGCSYLRSSQFETTIGEAKAMGLEPCSRCHPDF